MLPWGIFGEHISYCTIRRLAYQSILSLMVSTAIAIFAGRTDDLFFCNSNIYRSTGTINEDTMNEKYVESMKMERDAGGMIVWQSNPMIVSRSMNEMGIISA